MLDEKGEKVAAKAAVRIISCFWACEKAEYGGSDRGSRGVVSASRALAVDVAGSAAGDAATGAIPPPYLLPEMCVFIAIWSSRACHALPR